MYIQSVIIDGFKSYGARTEIKGFDREFNAITGLNGTGKSNILDAICFVLGITNLSNVRARTMQDLIYKCGQAGVTRASVTIQFDNSNPEKSPVTYESCEEITVTRQIVLGGKNRYLVNGSTVSNKLVADMFGSIQLNVNNPHFLIMQGRITKVLSMKPPEILSMIEEAAGTRMYEFKRGNAQKTIDRKNTLIDEMEGMVCEYINPKLQKLKDERSSYMEFQKVEMEFDHASRIFTSWQYVQTEAAHTTAIKSYNELVNKSESLSEMLDREKDELAEISEKVNKLSELRDAECDGSLAIMEAEVKKSEKADAHLLSKLRECNELLESEKAKLIEVKKSIKDDEKVLASKINEQEKVHNIFESLKEAQRLDDEALLAAQNNLQAVSSGLLANEDGENATIHDQLMNAQQALIETNTTIKQLCLQVKQAKAHMESLKPKMAKTEATFKTLKNDLQMKELELESLKRHLRSVDYEDGKLESLHDDLREATAKLREYQNNFGRLEHQFPRFSFHYKDPIPDFDHSKVRGVLCKLFTLKDPAYARALESAAGQKLFNIVVEDDGTAALMLKKCSFATRITFAPMNKLQSAPLNPTIVQAAKNLVGNEHVFLGKELICYDSAYESIMDWVFGQVFICSNLDAAEKVCSYLKKKAISLDGDIFDPNGIISGGAIDDRQLLLLEVNTFMSAEKEIASMCASIADLNEEIRACTPVANNYAAMKKRLNLRSKEIEMAKLGMEQSPHFYLVKEFEDTRALILSKEEEIVALSQGIRDKQKRVANLENNLKDLKSIKEKQIKEAEAKLKEAKKRAEASRASWGKRENEYNQIRLEMEDLENTIAKGKKQIEMNEETIKKLEEEIRVSTASQEENQVALKALKQRVKAYREKISQQNREISKTTAKKEKLERKIDNMQIDIASLKNSITRAKNTMDQCNNLLDNMRTNHKWIISEQKYFGVPNGSYDYEIYNPKEAQRKMNRLLELKQTVVQGSNNNALEVMIKQEEQFTCVVNKKGLVTDDKSKILSVIGELDVKKEDLVKGAWDKVNLDFHSILSSLLPGAHAKLKPVLGKHYLDGLEIKVGFGGLWKDSLDELSGGQRSLVALSLILAMLLFKPAPLYILDEVDAALDPSHTQNIGRMLKSHFRQSQFIIVSLKDGMFTNANVIFRTKFVDGMSAITRSTNLTN